MNKIEQFEAYRKKAIALGAIDLSGSNTPDNISPTATISQEMKGISGNYGETIPPELRALMATHVFHHMPGLEDIDGRHVVIAPQTSTLLVKEALEVLQRKAGDSAVIFYPEGNFRYNFHVGTFADTPIETVPIDRSTYKISAVALRSSFEAAIVVGKAPIAFVLETPNNPWMQVYNKDELREIAEVCSQYKIPIIQDLYLSGNESPSKDQPLIEEVAYDLPLKIMTVTGTRRQFGADVRGKIGAAVIRDDEWRQSLIELRRSEHMRFSADDVSFLKEVLPRIPYNNPVLRESLHQLRENAITQMKGIEGINIIVHPEAGPFVPMGFTSELTEKLSQAGFTDGYKLAEVLAIKGVSLLPLEDMNTSVMGFRVNVAYSDRLAEGLPKINAFIQAALREEEVYAMYEPRIADLYENIDPEKDPRLSTAAIRNEKLAELESAHRTRIEGNAKFLDPNTHQDIGSVVIEVRSIGKEGQASLDSLIERNFALVDKLHAKERATAASLGKTLEEMPDSPAQVFPEADVLKTNLEGIRADGVALHSASAYLMKFYDVKATGGCATMHTHPLGERFVEVYTGSDGYMTVKSETPILTRFLDESDKPYVQQPDPYIVILPPNSIAVTRIPKNVSHQFAPVGKVLGVTIHPNELAEIQSEGMGTGVMATQTVWFPDRQGTIEECLADKTLILPSLENSFRKAGYNSGLWINKSAPSLVPVANMAADVAIGSLNATAGVLETLFDKGLVGLAQSAYNRLFGDNVRK